MAEKIVDPIDNQIREIILEDVEIGCRCYPEAAANLDDMVARIKQIFLDQLVIEDRAIQKEVDELLGESQE